MDKHDLRNGLAYYTGTEAWHRHWLNQLVFTDGVKFFAENAGGGAFWLLDIIATEVLSFQREEPFLTIKLSVTEDNTGMILVTDGNDHHVWSKPLDYTDCPAGEWLFYLTDNIMLLPSEY